MSLRKVRLYSQRLEPVILNDVEPANLGPELVQNGAPGQVWAFTAGDPDWWNLASPPETGTSFVDQDPATGYLRITADADAIGISKNFVDVGKNYRTVIDFHSVSFSIGGLFLIGPNSIYSPVKTGTQSFEYTAAFAAEGVQTQAATVGSCVIRSISVREILD